ncbi:hypothetical protein RB200_05130 [Streptomyces sp. PmtG]
MSAWSSVRFRGDLTVTAAGLERGRLRPRSKKAYADRIVKISTSTQARAADSFTFEYGSPLNLRNGTARKAE